MTACWIDPFRDPRWTSLLKRHPRASVFHTPEWLEAIRRTYGYEPVVLTTTAPGEELRNGLVFCRVKSWITGSRNVSVPFSDHCDPLADTVDELNCLVAAMQRDQVENGAKYCEIRPFTTPVDEPNNLETADSYCMHKLDLRPALRDIYSGFHKSCIQRKIRRAEQEQLTYQHGSTQTLLDAFYHLLILTRRRQHLPPQPISWFRNLIACLGDSLTISLVAKAGQPVASILTLRHKDTLVYKYGCSDKRLSSLGGTPLLFWKAVQEARAEGLSSFDLGRSDWDNPGLIEFKDRLGARRSTLTYWRNGRPGKVASNWQLRAAKSVFRNMPSALLPLIGNLVYPHLHYSAPTVERNVRAQAH